MRFVLPVDIMQVTLVTESIVDLPTWPRFWTTGFNFQGMGRQRQERQETPAKKLALILRFRKPLKRRQKSWRGREASKGRLQQAQSEVYWNSHIELEKIAELLQKCCIPHWEK